MFEKSCSSDKKVNAVLVAVRLFQSSIKCADKLWLRKNSKGNRLPS